MEKRNGLRQCTAIINGERCDRLDRLTKEYCQTHYVQIRKYGTARQIRIAPVHGEFCEVEGCLEPWKTKGYCNFHSSQVKRHGKIISVTKQKVQRPDGSPAIRDGDGNKECIGCLEWLPESDYGENNANLDNLDLRCKLCSAARRHRTTKAYLKDMLEQQKFCCDICDRKLIGFHVDHDHQHCSGNVGCEECIRGLLCSYCNRGMGFVFDSQDILYKMIDYLDKWEERV